MHVKKKRGCGRAGVRQLFLWDTSPEHPLPLVDDIHRMLVGNIEIAKERLEEFCRHNGVRRLALFGSVLTERFSDASDIGVLVEFEPGQRVGYLRMARLERELSSVFGGRKVDLRTPNELSRYFRDEVLQSAFVQYASE